MSFSSYNDLKSLTLVDGLIKFYDNSINDNYFLVSNIEEIIKNIKDVKKERRRLRKDRFSVLQDFCTKKIQEKNIKLERRIMIETAIFKRYVYHLTIRKEELQKKLERQTS